MKLVGGEKRVAGVGSKPWRAGPYDRTPQQPRS